MPIIESIGVAAIGWVASPLVGKLLNEGFKSLGINADKKLQELRVTVLPLLKSVIEKAEGSAHQSEVEDWLQRLKGAYDDAEDALDLLNYHRLEREAANGVRSPFRSQKHLKLIRPVLNGGRNMLSLQKIKLKHMLNKLEKIACEALKLCDLLGAQPDQTAAVSDSRQTISLPPKKVFGRDEDREEIIRHLKMEPAAAISDPGSSSMSINTIREPESSGIPIIAIVGRPGLGKTTLAQYVCEQLKSELGNSKHFDLIMWVHASHHFSESEIMKEIIQLASSASESQDLGNLKPEALRLKMNEKLKKKKFMLVIDDVWCEGEDHRKNWYTLFTCLSNCCSPGSKILVTAQTNDALTKILVAAKGATVKQYIHDLEELEENDFLDLFIHHALPGEEIDSSLRKDLEEKCETIAKKLNKDPTAAKMVGETIALKLAGLLRSRGDWLTYLRTIGEKDWSGGDKTKALMWSYRHLPAHLQRCFSYCSLYPRGYKFQALKLVQLWMAQGFIKPDDQNKMMEDVGNDYLEMLVSRFYIQSHGSYYMLHELLCDLAEKVSRNDCVRIEGNGRSEIPSTIRHLCIPADKLNKKKKEICKLKRLRTLIVMKGEKVISEESNTLEESDTSEENVGTSEENVATYIFNSLKKLRVLVLKVNIENLAEFFGEMKHLRVLQVNTYSKFVLPESVRTLYQLQVFNGYFCVSKEKGNELEQLQNLNELRGCLRIKNLENVKSKESAIAANLKEKKYLDELYLVWSDSEDNVNSDLDVEILEGLQLPPYLTGLYLDGYRGQLWPSWPESQTSNIEKLELGRCKMLEELPPMDQLYPSCRSLVLWHLSKLKALHTLPPRLEKIEIIGTPFLTFATNEDLQMSRAVMNDSNNEASSAEHNMSVPADDMDITAGRERWLAMHEREMELIYNIQNEAKLILPSTLTELKLGGCNITDHALSACLRTLTSLTDLSLVNIQTVTCLPSEDVLGNLKALQSLNLRLCWALSSLGGIGSLPHLKKLCLSTCLRLDSKTAFRSSSLEIIQFDTCAKVDVILANADLPCLSHLKITRCHMRTGSLQFGNLPSLRSLFIWECPGLSFLVNVQELHSLEVLLVWNCSNLQGVMNTSRSCLRIIDYPILESSINIDHCSRVPMLGGIPVQDYDNECSIQ